MSTQSFTFKGKDRWGVAHTGHLNRDPAMFVEARYEGHWQELQVTIGDDAVGGIERNDDGRLVWWADAS